MLTVLGKQSQNLSGRALRRLPVLALARYIGVGNFNPIHSGTVMPTAPSNTTNADFNVGADVEVWLEGMEKVVKEQRKELDHLT